ncbi:hypothetical protein GGR55DRAFT_437384 [Xylaria sp. FL0064]|nr:hypothetical protein GGR55DRAFT_437384 [Xylaria sp. FL0064]
MSLFSNRVSSAPAESVVETNNFHEVLQHFNDACELVDKTTRFAIECQICQCRNLAVTNPESETPAEDRYENYIVLPYCGHAFGSHCLQKWIKYQKAQTQANPTCPSCRAHIGCERRHQLQVVVFGPKTDKATHTSEDIAKIRTTLGPCSLCQKVKLIEQGVRLRLRNLLSQGHRKETLLRLLLGQHIPLRGSEETATREMNDDQRHNSERRVLLDAGLHDPHTCGYIRLDRAISRLEMLQQTGNLFVF